MSRPTHHNTSPLAGMPQGDPGSFLSDEDVARLTGYRQSKKMIEALRSMHIPFILNFRGKPMVLRSAVDPNEARRRGPVSAKPQATVWEPSVLKR